MTILQQLQSPQHWWAFFEYKRAGGHMSAADEAALAEFIRQEGYRPVVNQIMAESQTRADEQFQTVEQARAGEQIRADASFALPQMHILSKKNTDKKRVVFTLPAAENTVLKMMAWCLQRYDDLMAPNLYSFRRGIGVKRAVQDLIRLQDIDELYSYKLDIHDYFNSVDVELLLPRLRDILQGEEDVYNFLARLLREPRVLRDGEVVTARKGIMAGLPVSAFLANVYLMDLDHQMAAQGALYARYSDDIIVFAEDRMTLERYAGQIREALEARHLTVNPNKCAVTEPGQAWEYLGFTYRQGQVDLSPAARDKIMAKLRRKARAIYRWKRQNGKEDLHAVRAYIKYVNQKFFDNPVHNELTWCRWYLPIINTDATLRELDHYIQQNIRYLITGRHTKANYNLRYETMRELGYRSLVGEYYANRIPDRRK